jgi:HPt (histidine-containing phosphotransfer) domain-containing protein
VLDEDTVHTLQSLRGQRGPSLFPELVEMFRQSEARQLASIGRGIAAHDVNAVADPVHSYGGNAATLGGLEIRMIAMAVEDAARVGNWEEVALCWNKIHPARQRFFSALGKLGGDAS